MKYCVIENKKIIAYYDDIIHEVIPSNAIEIDEDLYNSLMTFSQPILNSENDLEKLTMDHLDLFIDSEGENIESGSSATDEKIKALEDENLELKLLIAEISETNDNKILELQMAIAEIVEGIL